MRDDYPHFADKETDWTKEPVLKKKGKQRKECIPDFFIAAWTCFSK